MPDPRVSVIIPVYNTAQYLDAAFQSILTQTFTDFELIAIDDGSTDGSGAQLDRMAKTDARLRVIHQKNAGVTNALNKGLDIARGHYIARMDSDDLAYPDRFTQQVAALDSRPNVVAIGTQFRLIDPEGRPLTVSPMPCDHAALDARLMRDQSLSICHPSVMLRADALNKTGGYSPRFSSAQDVDLFLRLAEVGELANLDAVLMDYRLHLSSVGHSRRLEQLQNAWSAGKAAAARRGVPFDVPKPESEGEARANDDIWRMWGWRALGGGNVKTARHYARRAVQHNPFSRKNWWLVIIALRGY